MISWTFIIATGLLWTACVAAIAYRIGTVLEHMRTAPRIINEKKEAYKRGFGEGRQSAMRFDYEALERHSATAPFKTRTTSPTRSCSYSGEISHEHWR